MEQKTQVKVILKYLRKHPKGVTSMKAFWFWRITRLSSIIHILRNKGKHILTINEKNTFNSGYHARYVLLDENDWWV